MRPQITRMSASASTFSQLMKELYSGAFSIMMSTRRCASMISSAEGMRVASVTGMGQMAWPLPYFIWPMASAMLKEAMAPKFRAKLGPKSMVLP